MTEPTPLTLDVNGGPFHALRWGAGKNVAVGLHGITANAMSWRAVAAALPADWSLIALDQRGRGRSRDLPAPYSIDALARDARDAMAQTGATVLAGHSLGAYVCLATSHFHPGSAQRLVLVDGGLPLPLPPGLDVDGALAAVVGPMLARLRGSYPTVEAYVDLFRTHPAMRAYWTDDFDAYARYDARPTHAGVGAAAREEAVRVSASELLTRTDELHDALAQLSVPTTLIAAGRGMLDEPRPFLPEELLSRSEQEHPALDVVRLRDTNHYTVLIGARAEAVARAIGD